MINITFLAIGVFLVYVSLTDQLDAVWTVVKNLPDDPDKDKGSGTPGSPTIPKDPYPKA